MAAKTPFFGLEAALAKAVEVFGDKDTAAQWMTSPAIALSGARPVDLLQTSSGASILEAYLGRLVHGVYSQTPGSSMKTASPTVAKSLGAVLAHASHDSVLIVRHGRPAALHGIEQVRNIAREEATGREILALMETAPPTSPD